MKSIVTGGEGFIGSHVVDALVSLGHEVISIDDRSAPENDLFYRNDEAKYVTGDIRDKSLRNLYEKVDYVFHLAARSRIQPTLKSPEECFSVNVLGTQEVLEASRLAGVKKVIYSASSSFYGKTARVPFREDLLPGCTTPYSLSKWQGEQICSLYTNLYNLPTACLRYFNVYGPREPTRGQYAPVIGLFKRQAVSGSLITVIGDGSQRRDFTYVADVVEANIAAMNSEASGTFNIGTGSNISVQEIAKIIAKEFRSQITYLPERVGEARETLADTTKAKECLGWRAKKRIQDMILSY